MLPSTVFLSFDCAKYSTVNNSYVLNIEKNDKY